MNLTGNWIFKEEFETGVNTGFAKLSQEHDIIWGSIELTETVKGKAPLFLIQKIEGLVIDKKIIIKGVSYKVINGGDENTAYSLDTWEGTINSDGIIVGSSIDQDGVCGIFTMHRAPKN